jgi:two-component system response regulator MprA
MGSPNPRVLVIDDDRSILEVVEFALSERGYEVLLADDGAEGLARVERDRPDLIILDMVMPRRSGLTVLERLRQWGSQSPHIIVLSASDHPKQRDYAMSCGADAFLSKPVDIDVVADYVDSLLSKPV